MALGDQNLTDVSKEQAMTMPGMAYFAGTGPAGKKCGQCLYKGYRYEGKPKYKNGQESIPIHHCSGCRKAFELSGGTKPTPNIAANLHACKYFIQCPVTR